MLRVSCLWRFMLRVLCYAFHASRLESSMPSAFKASRFMPAAFHAARLKSSMPSAFNASRFMSAAFHAARLKSSMPSAFNASHLNLIYAQSKS